MHPLLERPAEMKHHQRQDEPDHDDLPGADGADDAHAGGQPCERRGGQAVDVTPLSAHDDAGADEPDAGGDALYDARGGGAVADLDGRHHRQRRAECDQAERAHAGRLAVQVAVDAERGAGERRRAEAQGDVEQVHARG